VILPGLLYLGDWGHAEHEERLKEIGIRRYAGSLITINNNRC
jgi:hypothetical protein